MVGRMIGLFVATAILGFLVAVYGEAFVLLQALTVLVALMVAGLLLSFRPSLILSALAAGLTQREETSPEKLLQHLAVMDRAHQLAWAGGFLLFMIALIQMVRRLGDPYAIGAATATGAIPLLYGVFAAEFIIGPLKHSLIAASPGAYATLRAESARLDRSVIGFILAGCCFLVVAIILALRAFWSPFGSL